MKRKADLNAVERRRATNFASKLLELLKSVSSGIETIEDRKFANTMRRLREELQDWGFNFDDSRK